MSEDSSAREESEVDEILRRYCLTDEEIAGMSTDQKAEAFEEALRAGVHLSQEPPREASECHNLPALISPLHSK
jgi:hypothetical protein